jgi:opacity protein-like surface antigen
MKKLRYLIFFFALLGSSSLRAQIVPAWGGGADLTDLSFGFSFQYVASDYKIVKNPNWRAPFLDPQTGKYVSDSLTSISSKASAGFAIGFITRYRVTDHLEIRTTPSLTFADRSVSYAYKTASQNTSKQIQSTLVEFPLSLKLKSDRIGNFRAYVLGGVKYSQAIGRQPNDANEAPADKQLKNIQGYGSYEAGLGCDIYFEFFKLSPEIKIGNSFGNVMVKENQPYANPISKLFLHTIMFSLYFE